MADNNDNNTSKRGFAAMPQGKRKELASRGGQSQGKENNPANFANDRNKARRAGEEGGSK